MMRAMAHLPSVPEFKTGLPAGGANAPCERFAAGKISAQAGSISAGQIKSHKDPKKEAPAIAGASFLEQVRRIELPYSAWEADVLPLNYTCMGLLT